MKKIFALFGLVLAFGLGVFVGLKTITPPPAAVCQANTVETAQPVVSVMLDEGNATIKTFTNLTVTATSTVFDVLKKVSNEHNVELTYKDYGGDMGVLVQSIDHKAGDTKTNMFWQYWVNNSFAKVGASNYHIKNGDVIEWKYIKDQFFN